MTPLLIPLLGQLIDRFLPDATAASEAKLKLFDAVQRGELAALDAEMRLALGQIEVNKADAQSDSLLRGGWRPMAGWVCVAGFGYEFLIRPLLPWLLTVIFGADVPELPKIDIEFINTLLFALLGLGGIRTLEKIKTV